MPSALSTPAIEQRLMTAIVDERARETPTKPYARIPTKNWRVDGWQRINYAQAARAIDRLSHWMDQQLGSSHNFETIAYFAISDLRYNFLIMAGMKTARKILLPDIGMPQDGREFLFKQTSCDTVFYTPEFEATANSMRSARSSVKVFLMLTLEELLEDAGDATPYVAHATTLDEAGEDPVMITHTSGTTGRPKPITQTNHTLAAFAAYIPSSGLNCCNSAVTLNTWPLFWIAGVFSCTATLVYFDLELVLMPLDTPAPLTGTFALEVIQHPDMQDVKGAYWTPSTLKDLVSVPGAIEALKHHDFAFFTGAKLDQTTGDVLAKILDLQNGYGSSESGIIPTFPADQEAWNYYRFDPSSGYRMIPYDDQLFEMVIERLPGMEDRQPVFLIFPDAKDWPMHDLFEPHPTKPDLWKPVGRADDLVKTSWLAKFHARDVESELEDMPGVKAAIMGGDGRPVPFVLVELSDNAADLFSGSGSTLAEKLWESMQHANAKNTELIHVPQDKILIAKGDRPLPRTAKGSIKRRPALELYARDIEELYATVEVK